MRSQLVLRDAFSTALRASVFGGAFLLVLASGCNRNGRTALGGSNSSGGSTDQQQTQNHGKPGAGSSATDNGTEPAQSVSGKPSVSSDDGSSSAVADQSVAEPGAPEGTLPADQTPGNGTATGHTKGNRAPRH